MAVNFDSSVLLGFYQSKYGASGSSLLNAGGTQTAVGADGKPKYAPTPPWDTKSVAPKASELVKQALAGRRFIDEGAAQLDLPGASADYKKLFSLYQGLNALTGLADRANTSGVSATEKARLASIFAKGLSEIATYTDKLKLADMRITRGDTMITNKSAVGTPKAVYAYKTGTVHTGAQADPVTAFQGAVEFKMTVVRGKVTKDITINLAEMTGDRTMGAVTSFINDKLAAEGLTTRFAVERTPGEKRVVEMNGTKVTLPALADNYNFKITGDSTESLTFSATTSKPAVYVTTYAGDPDPDKNSKTDDAKFESTLLKLDGTSVGAPGSRISSATLEGTIESVRSSKVGPDGSLYVLADVETSVDGQTVKGQRDVALMRYDSAGKLMYARTLGASDDAQGMALSIAADGRVAIAGKITGALNGATNGPINSDAKSGKSDSFVTVFDAKGDEMWTQRRGALADDEATEVAFGAGGVVFVAGRTKSTIPGATGGLQGKFDNYLMAVAPDGKGVPKTLFTTQFGSADDDTVGGLVVNGDTVTVASMEGGAAILRSFNVNQTSTETVRTDDNGFTNLTVTTTANGASNTVSTDYGAHDGGDDPVKVTTTVHTSAATVAAAGVRYLGMLEGGEIAGLAIENGQLYIAGTTRNANLSVGGKTASYAGGLDAFAARVSADLTDSSQDNLAYFGGTGDDTVTAMTVAGGKVWVAGRASEDQPGAEKISKKDGYLAAIDVGAGDVDVQRLTGKDGIATATSIAVDTSGASALDKLGLPKGTLLYADSQKIVSATSARAGDTFQVRTSEGGRLGTITIEANDTLETLAVRIKRIAGMKAKVEVVSDGEFRRLKISPAQTGASVEILPGKGGADALESLGLAAGVMRNTKIDDKGKSVSADGGGPVFGIGLPTDINLSTADNIKNALAVLAKSMTKIRDAYRTLETAAKPESTIKPGANGPVPAYLSNQISNYQAALDRLTGGG